MNPKNVGRVVGSMACVLALCGAAVAQERQSVTGTTVSLVPMKEFVPASGFAGFANQRLQASVVVMELPAVAYTEVSGLFKDLESARAQFAKQNVRVAAREELAIGGVQIPLVTGTQEQAGTTYDKWVALFKGARTVLITVQAPTTSALDGAAVRAMLASVALGAESSMADKLKSLPFVVEPRAPFRVVDVLGGSGVLMTVGELDVDPTATQPLLIVAYQVSAPLATTNVDAVAEQLLKQTRDFDTATIETRERVPFAGTSGVLLGGTHVDKGTPKRFVQYVAIGQNGRAVRMIASANDGAFKELQPAIAAIAQSIAFK